MHELIAARLLCPHCGMYLEEHSFRSTCPNCDALLDYEVQTDIPVARLKAAFAERLSVRRGWEASGVWRYRELVMPTAKPGEIVSFPEGNTPLIENPRIGTFAGCRNLLIKHEGMNPSGSFKDRGMTVAMTQARRIGAKAVACASTGNTSASLAAYAAIAGLPGVVVIPAGRISTGKLAQTMAHGAKMVAVRGSFDDCLRLLREASEQLGVYVVNSVNPFRLAGQRAIVFEMLQQLDWDAPDWVVLPAGNLGNTSAFGEALDLAHRCGLISRIPRIVAVQASGAAPFARAFAGGFKQHPRVAPETVATAIRIGDPASWDRAIRAITQTNGLVTHVSDDDILAAKDEIDRAGIGCEPASAASIAAIRQLIAERQIKPSDRVVAVLTGHVLKDPGIIVDRGAAPVEIDADLGALSRVIIGG
jgi:threonine synthase